MMKFFTTKCTYRCTILFKVLEPFRWIHFFFCKNIFFSFLTILQGGEGNIFLSSFNPSQQRQQWYPVTSGRERGANCDPSPLSLANGARWRPSWKSQTKILDEISSSQTKFWLAKQNFVQPDEISSGVLKGHKSLEYRGISSLWQGGES